MPIRPTQQRAPRRGFALAVAAAAMAAACGADVPAPNVLLLVLDTTRADRCSFNGYERPTTPRLDEFAKDAVVFREAWSPANWTGPAHASLFTGLRPEHHGFNSNARPVLTADRPTIAERFAAAGYQTACFSNNPFVSPGFGLTRGFGRFDALYAEQLSYPPARETHERAFTWAKAAAASGRPFFLFVNDMEPHLPYTPAADEERLFLRDGYPPEDVRLARSVGSREATAFALGLVDLDAQRRAILSDLYDAEVRTLDAEVGRLLDRLRADGLLDSTVVAIVGDHGESLGEHHVLGHTVGVHRQLLHVPMILRHPRWFSGGRTVTDVVRLEDLAPTLLEVCGLRVFDGIDGRSLTGGLAGRVAFGAQAEHDLMSRRAAEEFPGADGTALARGIRSVFDGTYHLIVWSDGERALYDARLDPDETDDLAGRRPADVERLSRLLR